MSHWTKIAEDTYTSADDAYTVEIFDDGTVFVTDASGTQGADMSEYADEEDGLNPNLVKEDFASLADAVDEYGWQTDGLPAELLERGGLSL